MEFYFLGTGAGIPSIERNVSSLALRFFKQKGVQWIFDCGEATQHQILHTPITLTKVEKIFISHLHGDHIFGLPGLLGSRSFQGAETPLVIYGPLGIQEFVQIALKTSRTFLRYPLSFVEIEQEGMLFQENGVTVEVCELDHVMPSFGFKIIEEDKPGELLIEKIQAESIPPGPIYQKLKKEETVILEDGRVINGSNYVGEKQKGRRVIITGDTKPVDALIAFAKDADLLIHEATFRSDKKEHAHKYGHSTIEDVTKLATQANVKQLILTHISSRYAGEAEALQKEAEEYFSSTVVASDKMVFKM